MILISYSLCHVGFQTSSMYMKNNNNNNSENNNNDDPGFYLSFPIIE